MLNYIHKTAWNVYCSIAYENTHTLPYISYNVKYRVLCKEYMKYLCYGVYYKCI